MTKLSVNINKIAVLRNSRGGNVPNVVKTALDIETFGADGITVHPRPDERHIKYQDVYDLKERVTTEFNIEGNCTEDKFVKLVLDVLPTQVTLVPDAENAITSSAGWDVIKNLDYLTDMVAAFKEKGIRVSIFLDPNPALIESAKLTGADRIELYTESYAYHYEKNPDKAIEAYIETANLALEYGLGVNGGHDLSLNNLAFLKKSIPHLAEVSIGHALIAEALYLGLENTIQLYQRQLGK